MVKVLKIGLLHYAEYLIGKYSLEAQQSKIAEPEEQFEQKYGYGSLAGKIIMPEDFDQPLEDLKEYM